MVRLRSTVKARMCTGGPARRIDIQRRPTTAKIPASQADVQMRYAPPTVDAHFCALCQDGGDLWICDMNGCERAICSVCIKVPDEDVSKLKHPDVKFTCVPCHWQKCRTEPLVYSAFTINKQPVLSKFVQVKGTFETATRATTLCLSTVLIHIRFHSFPHHAHFTNVKELLSEYYIDDDLLRVFDLPFNVEDGEAGEKWSADVKELIADLSGYRKVVVFVTTHSDPNSGDLWLGESRRSGPCAQSVSDWLDIIVEPFKPILSGSILYFMVCGAVINNASSFAELKHGLTSLGVGNALAFDAERLSTVNFVDFLAKVTQSVTIHGFTFTEALEQALKESFKLGRHTNVFHFTPDCVTKYLWAHKDIQPWGTKLPLQCPQCGILQPWTIATLPDHRGYGMECKNVKCGKNQGRERHSFQALKPDGLFVSAVKHWGWLKIATS